MLRCTVAYDECPSIPLSYEKIARFVIEHVKIIFFANIYPELFPCLPLLLLSALLPTIRLKRHTEFLRVFHLNASSLRNHLIFRRRLPRFCIQRTMCAVYIQSTKTRIASERNTLPDKSYVDWKRWFTCTYAHIRFAHSTQSEFYYILLRSDTPLLSPSHKRRQSSAMATRAYCQTYWYW